MAEHTQSNYERPSKPKASKIYLRQDQLIIDIGKREYQDDHVKIFAPEWVRAGVKILRQHIPIGTEFCILDKNKSAIKYKLDHELNIKDLVMIARNEPHNTSGIIQLVNYKWPLNDPSLIYSIKDLIRQCIIVGPAHTVSYGGYPRGNPVVNQDANLILIDQVGLQFQQAYNSGRLVLIGEKLPVGILDELIFKKVVGQSKKSIKEVKEDRSGRYIKEGHLYFDTYAYKMFVANDFLLTALAINRTTEFKVNFKFLKYGTGYFAGRFSWILEKEIYNGVCAGLKLLFRSGLNKSIALFEFPFYQDYSEIRKICLPYKLGVYFNKDDALKVRKYLVTATTNCSDPHAATGNEMGYSSVDAAIAENLKYKANKFNPVINKLMGVKYIETRLDKLQK